MTLNPQVAAFLDGLREQNAPGWEELSPAEGREVFLSLTELFGDGPEVNAVEDRFVRDDLAVRIYWPSGDGPHPAIVYFHGGGWVLGDLDTHDALCRRLTCKAEAVVISVDYRLSPENVFPGALDDCYEATQFVAQHATNLNVDSSRIIVAGDSAGGNLAAAVALRTTGNRGPQLCLQVLIYPVLDHRCDSASYGQFAEGYGLTKTAMQWFWKQYLGENCDTTNSLISPIMSGSLQDLPPAHIVTAEYDVLRDEIELYAHLLEDAGVPTTHRRYEGMIHGFVHFCGTFDVGRDAISDIANVIRVAGVVTQQTER